jgi:hypothetical protein
MDELCLALFNLIICFIVLCGALCRDVDGNGMDNYDRDYGIAGEGVTRNAWGQIYRDGKYSFWDNLFDHNPYYY